MQACDSEKKRPDKNLVLVVLLRKTKLRTFSFENLQNLVKKF